MLFVFIAVFIMTAPFTVWLFVIRRYCVRNGMGFTPGANWQTTMWIDWQEAKELAADTDDRKMMRWCRLFLTIQLVFMVIWLLAFVGSIARI